MPWFHSILHCCGIRKPHDSSRAQPGCSANSDPDALTDFIEEIPPYKEKGTDHKNVSGYHLLADHDLTDGALVIETCDLLR
jgi:hypothetical protein